MSGRTRLRLFLVAGAGLFALLLWGYRGLPPVGHYRGPYGDVLSAAALPERHVTDVVSAINFDYRAFDTLGEEFILFTSVMGVLLLLRRESQEAEGAPREESPERRVPRASEAVRVLTLAFTGPTVLFGLYVVSHGQLTPGGGFQGGVILATAPLTVYLASDLIVFRHIARQSLIEAAEALGAGGFALLGFGGLWAGGALFQNVLPLGRQGDVFSGGMIPLISAAVGLEVAGGFLLLLYSFLQQTLQFHSRGKEG